MRSKNGLQAVSELTVTAHCRLAFHVPAAAPWTESERRCLNRALSGDGTRDKLSPSVRPGDFVHKRTDLTEREVCESMLAWPADSGDDSDDGVEHLN